MTCCYYNSIFQFLITEPEGANNEIESVDLFLAEQIGCFVDVLMGGGLLYIGEDHLYNFLRQGAKTLTVPVHFNKLLKQHNSKSLLSR